MVPAKLTEPLSNAELDVLKLYARGFRPSAIARALEMTPGEVCAHCAEIKRKLRVDTRGGAIALAFCYGILTPGDVL